MEKILIIYYTGTNNTKYLVEREVQKLNVAVDTYDIIKQKGEMMNFSFYSKIIINYPIYAFNPPRLLLKELKKLNIQNKDYIIIKNSGEPLHLNDASSRSLIKLMNKANNHLLAEYHLLMPYYILFRHNNKMVKQMLQYNESYLDYIVKDLNRSELITTNFTSRIMHFIGKIERLGARLNSRLIHVDNKLCIHCGKCIKECKFNNISVKDNKIIFSNKCELCMQCSSTCPTNAIKMGVFNHWKVNGVYHLNKISSDDKLKQDYLEFASKRFKKVYKPYYDKLDKKL